MSPWDNFLRLFVLALPVYGGLAACAALSPSYKAAGCARFRYNGYNILACDDDSVGRHCKKLVKQTDSGQPLTYHPRACHVPGKAGRKANIIIGKSHLNCLPHEIAHQENPGNPKMVEERYPCVGDRLTL